MKIAAKRVLVVRKKEIATTMLSALPVWFAALETVHGQNGNMLGRLGLLVKMTVALIQVRKTSCNADIGPCSNCLSNHSV